jgi:DNA polymerase-3 subunit alpha
MKRAMKTIQIDRFSDLVSLIALYRPGPMDNIESYAKRKQGLEPVTYLDNQLKPILNPTFGIIIYQEQIMQIAQTMAGFSLSKADDFRRAISKKDNEIMLALKQAFLDGAVSKGYKSDHALSVYNHILKFADYGFNKSHSVAYATLTYQMAYLKTYHPHAFYAAILNSSAGTSDTKLMGYMDELRTLKIKLMPPNIQIVMPIFISKVGSTSNIKELIEDQDAKPVSKDGTKPAVAEFKLKIYGQLNHSCKFFSYSSTLADCVIIPDLRVLATLSETSSLIKTLNKDIIS